MDSIDERQEIIARAAAHLVAEGGLEKLTMRAVAQAAGCSRGLVEHYFKNKESLINAADSWANAQAIARISEEVADRKGLSALEARLRQILPFNETILNEWRVRIGFRPRAIAAQMRSPEKAGAFKPIFTALHCDIKIAAESGEVAADIDVQAVAEMVLFVAVGIATSCLSDSRLRSQSSLEERVRMIIALLRSGTLTSMRFKPPDTY